jgi:hypothetical protein
VAFIRPKGKPCRARAAQWRVFKPPLFAPAKLDTHRHPT